MTNSYQKLAVAATVAFLSLASTEAKSVQAAFITPYDPSNFTLTNTNANGFVDTTGAPASITLTGGDNLSGVFGTTDYTTTALFQGLVSFNWEYFSFNSSPELDPFGFLLNGNFTQLTDNNGSTSQSGIFNISVNTGDIFGWRVATIDNAFGPAKVTLSNFNASTPATDVPEPSSILAILTFGALGLGSAFKSQQNQ
ncbi:MAG TPA: PEP-CTERM sorting domain-containing protein [Cyanobacteria bacterium UBA11372]|nr:PEP-CTERM sorting domain-containing protein [Cyanobacteria bacterium UBA11372]